MGGEEAAEGGGEIAVEDLREMVGDGEVDGVGKVDESRRDAAV